MQWKAFAVILVLANMFTILALFDLLTWPLDPISKGARIHLYPLSSRSLFREVYLIVFLKFAASKFLSKLQVSSIKYITLAFLSSSTKSGLDVVTRTSGGIVPPLMSRPDISEYTSMFSGLFCTIVLVMWLRTVLWRQVNLPWFKEMEQKFKICSSVPWLERTGK